MRKIGEVKAILNDRFLLVTSEEELSPDEHVTVFTCVQTDEIRAAGVDQPILYPKGELKVICPQENRMYLVERFREVHRTTKRITTPSFFARGLTGLAAQLQLPETKEIIEEVPGEWSAELNEKQMLNVKFSTSVSVGDPIGRLS